MPPEPPPVVDLYDRHPINEAQGLEALRRRGRDIRALVPEDLYCPVPRRTDKGLFVGCPLRTRIPPTKYVPLDTTVPDPGLP